MHPLRYHTDDHGAVADGDLPEEAHDRCDLAEEVEGVAHQLAGLRGPVDRAELHPSIEILVRAAHELRTMNRNNKPECDCESAIRAMGRHAGDCPAA